MKQVLRGLLTAVVAMTFSSAAIAKPFLTQTKGTQIEVGSPRGTLVFKLLPADRDRHRLFGSIELDGLPSHADVKVEGTLRVGNGPVKAWKGLATTTGSPLLQVDLLEVRAANGRDGLFIPSSAVEGEGRIHVTVHAPEYSGSVRRFQATLTPSAIASDAQL